MNRTPPYNSEAEQSVIGSALIDPRCLTELMAIVKPEHFFLDGLGIVYRHLSRLHEAGQAIDHLTLTNSLKSAGEWERCGGVKALTECAQAVPHAGHAAYYAEIVADKASRRAIIDATGRAMQLAYADDTSPSDILTMLETSISSANGIASTPEITSIGKAAELALEDLDTVSADRSIMIGIDKVDRHFGVLLPGELTVIAARPGAGKTTLATQILMHGATHERRGLLVSLEMESVEIAKRVMCSIAEIDQKLIRTKKLDKNERGRYFQAANDLQSVPCDLWAPGTATIADIRSTLRYYHRRNPLSIIAVDQISHVAQSPTESRLKRYEQIGLITKGLKRMARELKVPVIALNQLNREAERQRPGLKDLAESGSVEQDADQVLFLHKPNPNDPTTEFIIGKNRHGERAMMELYFDGHTLGDCPVEAAPNYSPEFDTFNSD